MFSYIFPVSAFLQPYTSPNPPRPIILCTLKSFMVSCGEKKKAQIAVMAIFVCLFKDVSSKTISTEKSMALNFELQLNLNYYFEIILQNNFDI